MAYTPATSAFPTSKDSPVDPTATSVTGTVDHAGLESFQNDAIKKLQNNVGITNSADSDSLNYKLTNSSSCNPGHKHTLAGGISDITATAAEVNKLDGFTGTKDDLNYAKDLRATGVTTTEFDKLDGLTSTTAELNKLDGASANVTAANLNTLTGGGNTTLHTHTVVRIMGNALSADQNTNNASKPAKTVNNGTNLKDTTLDFDADSDEWDEWQVPIPLGITIASATLYIVYRMASATDKKVVWYCKHNGVASGETWDEAYAQTDTFTADTVADAVTKIKIASKTLTTTAWTAGDSLSLQVGRDANNAGDDATGDAKLMYWLLEIK